MAKKTSHTPGTFCWAALGTSDADDASRFYADLFGWNAIVQVIHGVSSATLCADGLPICALFAMAEDLRKAGFPPNWLPYLSVSSADETAARIDSFGGKMIEPPFDVPSAGRMAPFSDAADAKAAIWQPKGFIGAGSWAVPNALVWFELNAKNIDAAGAFYRNALGWQIKHTAGETRFSVGDEVIAGMKPLAPDSTTPAFWRIYFQVTSCDAMVEKARKLGGSVRLEPIEARGLGRIAVVADRQNAEFALLEPTPARDLS